MYNNSTTKIHLFIQNPFVKHLFSAEYLIAYLLFLYKGELKNRDHVPNNNKKRKSGINYYAFS